MSETQDSVEDTHRIPIRHGISHMIPHHTHRPSPGKSIAGRSRVRQRAEERGIQDLSWVCRLDHRRRGEERIEGVEGLSLNSEINLSERDISRVQRLKTQLQKKTYLNCSRIPLCHEHRGSRDPAAGSVTRRSWPVGSFIANSGRVVLLAKSRVMGQWPNI
jgi:hypothetical protein